MNSSRTAPMKSSRLQLCLRTTALMVMTLFLIPVAGPAAETPTQPPDLGDCQNLSVEAGNTVVFHVYAAGVQIYRWDGTAWVFVAPDAVLYGDSGHHGVVGTHYAGPTWETTSGNKVVGSVLERCIGDADAIPWLLLETVSTEGPGVFQNVTFIQRVNTTGGLVPFTPGSFVGEEVRVPYTAEYFFYQ